MLNQSQVYAMMNFNVISESLEDFSKVLWFYSIPKLENSNQSQFTLKKNFEN